ncbi:DUF1295 domain-containing protein [Rhizobium sp. BK251]|uniref:DUF1295 domain-containing protein n=1 Tax=Rhizobium sp. BK251 TaxID=2512125 RepID=UPI00105101E1|nr:DUF1295 domain-containing protein [Rhizobium sp. BK251]TCL68401.1 steroid 5-alpha reductase family enzyme [Rhizobium sp. BK251]
MTLATLLILLAVAISVTMAFAWSVAIRTGSSGWIDVVWSFGVGAGGVIGSLAPLGTGGDISPRRFLVAAIIGIWSLRLGLHIAARTHGGGDDPRYRQLREEWGESYRGRLFWFLQIQAAVAFILILCLLTAAHRPAPALDLGDLAGLIIFVLAVVGEAAADRQLSRFGARPENRGEVCDVGLWHFSRHPNYFFEWLVWVAIAAIAVDFGGAYPWGWLALAGPLLMYWLLVHISGIPPLEAHMLRSRGERFRIYQQRVNAFWPGPPRHPSHDAPAEKMR